MSKRDYYDILSVQRNASEEDIKQAYRKLAREHHPDLHQGDKNAERKFKEVQEAFDVLGDKEKRQQYDYFGRGMFDQAGAGQRGRTFHWSSQAGGPHADIGGAEFGGFDDILGELFGGRMGTGRARRGSTFQQMPGEDVEAEVRIPFRTAALGGELDVTVRGAHSERLTITIPAGVNDGARLRLAGKGQPSSMGGKPGDLHVHVHVEPHPYFTRKGLDIYVNVPITISEAVLGATIDVPTLNGKATVKVPPSTSSGQKLRLRGKGSPKQAGDSGDQYVVIRIVAPKEIDETSKEIIGDFAKRNPMNPRENLGW